MDLLLYFPIRLIVFKSKVCGDSIKLEERIKFIAEYTYQYNKKWILQRFYSRLFYRSR